VTRRAIPQGAPFNAIFVEWAWTLRAAGCAAHPFGLQRSWVPILRVFLAASGRDGGQEY
jgi:hypothetical protein